MEKDVQSTPSSFKADVWALFGFDSKKELDKSYIYNSKVKYFGKTTIHSVIMSPTEDANEVQPKVSKHYKKVNIPGDQHTLHQCCQLSINSERANKITRPISRYIFKDLLPYNVVDNEGFRYMLKAEFRIVFESRIVI